ncbi:MAG: hypothetical protein C0470_05615 [Verminephrobacter sp.]|nr:hypothetical protein [Verminephrobacter sp.]
MARAACAETVMAGGMLLRGFDGVLSGERRLCVERRGTGAAEVRQLREQGLICRARMQSPQPRDYVFGLLILLLQDANLLVQQPDFVHLVGEYLRAAPLGFPVQGQDGGTGRAAGRNPVPHGAL